MIVEVKEIPVRHNGQRCVKGEQFEIDAKQYVRIKAYVEVIDESDNADKPLEKMTVAELREYAASKEIDLGEATKKEEILQVLQGAQE